MYCIRCGQRLADKAKFCPACGLKIEGANTIPEENVQENGGTGPDSAGRTPDYDSDSMPYGAGVYRNDQSGYGRYDGSGIDEETLRARKAQNRAGTCILFGIVSLVFMWVPVLSQVFGVVGLVMSVRTYKDGDRNKGIAGITLNIFGLVFGILFLIAVIGFGVVVSQYFIQPISDMVNAASVTGGFML